MQFHIITKKSVFTTIPPNVRGKGDIAMSYKASSHKGWMATLRLQVPRAGPGPSDRGRRLDWPFGGGVRIPAVWRSAL